MKKNLFFAGFATLIAAFTLWQWSHTSTAANENQPIVNGTHGWSKFFSKFDNTSASADSEVGAGANSAAPQSIADKYQHYRGCLEAIKPCEGFNANSEAEYMQDVREQMLSELTAYYEGLKNQPRSITSDDQTLARDLVTDATPDVQIIGLEILDLCEPSQTNLEAITDLVKSAFDDGVVSVGADSLLRYKDTPAYQAAITKMFVDQIGLGVNDQAALSAIDKLPPFLNKENVGEFRTLRDNFKTMSEKERLQTRRYKALDAVLKNFGG